VALRNPHQGTPQNGAERPRLAPPLPLVHEADKVAATAVSMGLTLMPWQVHALKYITAKGPDKRHAFHDVCIVVARQNGKTTLMQPYIIHALKAGKRVMHIAQTRDLPRLMFEIIATEMGKEPDLLPRRRGRIIWPRYGAGSEEIILNNGGSYRIAAATRGGARGYTNDIVIVDELREMLDDRFLNAARPTLTASDDPQMLYLSNAGTDASVILNSLRDRAADDPSLAYLEWSSAPDRATDDRVGWLEANPAAGHIAPLWDYLERTYTSYKLSGSMGSFETEHLCRWVSAILPPIIARTTWEELRGSDVVPHGRPVMGVALDPNGKRASAVLAWLSSDGRRVSVKPLLEGTGDPMSTADFGAHVKELAAEYHVKAVGYDGSTDAELSKFFKKPERISGALLTNASSLFVNRVEAHTLDVDDAADVIGPDIEWTGRKTHAQPGTWTAIPLSTEHPVTALLATIRAVWLASGPKPTRVRVH
jgi:hypothetical protein